MIDEVHAGHHIDQTWSGVVLTLGDSVAPDGAVPVETRRGPGWLVAE